MTTNYAALLLLLTPRAVAISTFLNRFEPFSKLEAARHDRRPSFALCGIAASMGHAREESIVHHVDKHKALGQLVEAHDDVERSDAALLLFFGQCAAQRRHLRVQAAIDLQEQRCRSWNPVFGYARAFELPPPGTTPLRRSAFATASHRECDLHPQVQARPQNTPPRDPYYGASVL